MWYKFYKDLVLNTFNITNSVNKVSVKYITKNIKTDVRDVFLEIKTHARASIISSRNLRLTATRVCIVPESGSRFRPLKKIMRVIAEITEKSEERMTISLINRFSGIFDLTSRPVPRRKKLNTISNKTYLQICLILMLT
jgi:hypothetical protein